MSVRLTRRRLLATGASGAAALYLPRAAAAAGKTDPWLDRATYRRRVGETFMLRRDDGHLLKLHLARVRNLSGRTRRGRAQAGRSDSFMLVFKPVRGTAVEQGTFYLSHRALGRTQLFVVPTVNAVGGTRYVVIVNRADR